MANPTMTLIASNTVGSGGVSSVTFSSIPQTGYTDLKVVLSARVDSTDGQVLLWFNNDTTAGNYRRIRLLGEGGSGASSSSASDSKLLFVDDSSKTASTFGNTEIYVPNYLSSNQKSISVDSVIENNASYAIDGLFAGLWTNTSAITTVQLAAQTGNFVQYSTFYLYGISSS